MTDSRPDSAYTVLITGWSVSNTAECSGDGDSDSDLPPVGALAAATVLGNIYSAIYRRGLPLSVCVAVVLIQSAVL